MDASSTGRARLALCTGAVLAVAAFTGEAHADDGLTPLVSGSVSGTVSGTVEQLPSPVAEPVAEVVSSVTPTVDALPPAVEEVVEDVTQLSGEIAGPAIPGVREQASSGQDGNAAGAEAAPQASSTPEAVAPAEEAAPTHAVEASPASSGFAPPARTAAPPPRPRVSNSHTSLSRIAEPVSGDFAPGGPIAPTATADSSPAPASEAPSSPRPSTSELPAFDALLPPLGAFAFLLAVTLGLFALTAPSALGAGLHPAVALLRSADVHFRLVRPG